MEEGTGQGGEETVRGGWSGSGVEEGTCRGGKETVQKGWCGFGMEKETDRDGVGTNRGGDRTRHNQIEKGKVRTGLDRVVRGGEGPRWVEWTE